MPETPLSPEGLYSARPTVRINGAEVEGVQLLAQSMEVREQEDGLSSLELTVLNHADRAGGTPDYAFEDEQALKLGDRITVYTGTEQGPGEIFSCVITALEAEFPEFGAPQLTVLSEDLLQSARMKRRTRTHADLSLADLARSIAGDLGLTPTVTGFTDSIGTWVQLNESDLAFLRRLLARRDGDVQVVGSELHVSPRADVRRDTVELTLHSQLRRATVLADLAHQVNELTVTGWDAAAGRRVTGRSTGVHAGPGTGRRGGQLLESTLGRRSHHLSHMAVRDEAEARALADSAFDDRQRRFVTVVATAVGNSAIRVGTHVTLSGLTPRFNNTYYVTRCCHRFDLVRGYETDFHAEGAFLGSP